MAPSSTIPVANDFALPPIHSRVNVPTPPDHAYGNDVERKVSLKEGELEHVNTTWTDVKYEEIDPEVDKRITRKFDTHVIPLLFGLWLLAFIDRSNIGNARIQGLAQDLHLNGNKFNIALTVFYVPYIVVDVPSNLVLKYFRAGYYLPFLIFAWGVVSTCTGFVKTYHGLLAARFFLGLCEGGLLGGMII